MLGRGGMGEVFLAWDRRLERRVAIKKIRRQKAAEAEVHRQRLLREARAGARLGHPAIVQVYDIVELEGFDWLVMEYVDGPTVEQLLRTGALELSLALGLARQVAEGLAEAHGKGLLHRDLKSENVMIDADGRAKILDFGLAKRLELMADGQLTSAASLTQSGEVMGTCRAMSPEQARGLDLDGRSDLFSLGVLLYEMLTGASPFRADSPVATLSLVCHHRQAAVQSVNPEVPAEISAYVDHLLEKVPAARPRSANKVVRDLRRLMGELGVSSTPVGMATVTPFPEHRARPSARPAAPPPAPPAEVPWASRHAGRAAALTLLLVAVGVAWVYRDDLRPAPAGAKDAAAARRVVAVLEIANLAPGPESDWLASALRILVADELTEIAGLRVVADEEVGRTRPTLGFGAAQNLAPASLGKAKTLLGADLVLLGAYRLDPRSQRVLLLLNAQDTATGEVAAIQHELDGDDLLGSAGGLGRALRERLGGDEAAPAAPGEHASGLPAAAAALRDYTEGVEARRRFELAEARELLERATRAEPSSPLAWVALAETWQELGDDPKAREAAERAGLLAGDLRLEERRRIEAFGHEVAHRWTPAIELWRELHRQEPGQLEHGIHLAHVLLRAGRFAESLETLAELRRLPPPAGEDLRLALLEGFAWRAAGDDKKVLTLGAALRERATRAGAPLTAARAAQLEVAARIRLDDDLQLAAELAAAARSAFARAGDSRGEIAILRQEAMLAIRRQHVDTARLHLEDALKLARSLGDGSAIAQVASELGQHHADRGQFADARSHLEAALSGARTAGDARVEAVALGQLASLALRQKDLDAARDHARLALAQARAGGFAKLAATTQLTLARVMAAAGDAAEARRLLDDGELQASALGDRRLQGDFVLARAELLEVQGERDAARRNYLQARELLPGHPGPAAGLARLGSG